MRLVRFVSALSLAAVFATGCGKAVYLSNEGQYCSPKQDEDPYFECSKTNDLICINTFPIEVRDGVTGMVTGTTPAWLCRLACNPGDSCPAAGDVCCSGPIYGRNYGKTAACVPVSVCSQIATGDGGVKDAAVDRVGDARADGAGDGAADTGDAGGDAGDAGDAGVADDAGDAADAPTPDAPEADGAADAPALDAAID